MQNLDMERKREIILQKLKLEYEDILQNTTLENVMRYLAEKLRGIGETTIDTKKEDGTIITYCLQGVHPWQLNKIEVEYTTVVIPKGDVEKAHGYWGNYVAMIFEGLQLQTNTVRINAECRHPFILPIFDRLWANMLKDFGAAQDDTPRPLRPKGIGEDEYHPNERFSKTFNNPDNVGLLRTRFVTVLNSQRNVSMI